MTDDGKCAPSAIEVVTNEPLGSLGEGLGGVEAPRLGGEVGFNRSWALFGVFFEVPDSFQGVFEGSRVFIPVFDEFLIRFQVIKS